MVQAHDDVTLRKNDFEQVIVRFIGSQKGSMAQFEEIRSLFKNGPVIDKGIPAKAMARQTLYNYLNNLKNKGFVEPVPRNEVQGQRGFYRLTQKGMKRLAVINALWCELPGPLVVPLDMFFGLDRDVQGRAIDARILLRIARPDVVQAIEEVITKRRTMKGEKMLGSLLCTLIMWDFKGILSKMSVMLEGKEDLVLQEYVQLLKQLARINS
jgi:DNA-binding PadR family transcriptional regulator